MRLPPRLLGALLAGGHVRSPLEDRLEQATQRRRNRAESGPQLVATSGRNRAEGRASASAVAGNGMGSEPVLANLAWKSRLSHRPATRSAVAAGDDDPGRKDPGIDEHVEHRPPDADD